MWKWKSQSCPTLCNSTVHGVLQARILEWVAFSFSRGSSQPRDQTQVSQIVGRFFTSWATKEAQEHWSGYPIPSPLDLRDPRIKVHCRQILYQLSYQGSPSFSFLSPHMGKPIIFISLGFVRIKNGHFFIHSFKKYILQGCQTSGRVTGV